MSPSFPYMKTWRRVDYYSPVQEKVGSLSDAQMVKIAISLNDQRSKRSIKRDVKKKVPPRPEARFLSRDPAH